MLDSELELLAELIRGSAEPLPDIDDPEFGELFDRFADARDVLLGANGSRTMGRRKR